MMDSNYPTGGNVVSGADRASERKVYSSEEGNDLFRESLGRSYPGGAMGSLV